MRRIATLVATGAVAAAAIVGLAGAPASASTTAAASLSGNATTVASGDISAQAVHNWHSYNGTSRVYGYGTYSHTSTHTTVYGYIQDHSSGSSYAGLEIRWYTAGNASYDYKILYNAHHGTTAKFPAKYYSTKHTHLYIREVLVHKTSSGWTIGSVGHFHKYF